MRTHGYLPIIHSTRKNRNTYRIILILSQDFPAYSLFYPAPGSSNLGNTKSVVTFYPILFLCGKTMPPLSKLRGFAIYGAFYPSHHDPTRRQACSDKVFINKSCGELSLLGNCTIFRLVQSCNFKKFKVF